MSWSLVTTLAERLDLDLSRPVRTMSKGNKQKVGLVQAFMHEPALLILDEPTSGLDTLMQQEFLGLVQDARAAGRTVFMSSHVLAEVQQSADRVAIVREGRLAGQRLAATVLSVTGVAVIPWLLLLVIVPAIGMDIPLGNVAAVGVALLLLR